MEINTYYKQTTNFNINRIASKIAQKLDEIDNLYGANELYLDAVNISTNDCDLIDRLNKFIIYVSKRLPDFIIKKLDMKIISTLFLLSDKKSENKDYIQEYKKLIIENGEKIKLLYKEVKEFHNTFDTSIDWNLVNKLTTKERYKFFDTLAKNISKIPVYQEVTVQCDEEIFKINERDKEVFEICYREAKFAKMRLDSDRKGNNPLKKLEFNPGYYNSLKNREKIEYCLKLINYIYKKPVTTVGVEKEIAGNIISIDQKYSKAFDLLLKNYLLIKKLYSCEIDLEVVEQITDLEERFNYFKTVAENIFRLPKGEKPVEVSWGNNKYQINSDYKDTFEICHREAKFARIRLNVEQRNPENEFSRNVRVLSKGKSF